MEPSTCLKALAKSTGLAKSPCEVESITQLASVFSIKNLKWIFIAIFLLGVPSGSLQTFFSQFAKDAFNGAGDDRTGILYYRCNGYYFSKSDHAQLLKKLKVHASGLGMLSEIIAYGLIAASVYSLTFPFYRRYDHIRFWRRHFGPAVNGIASNAVSSEEQAGYKEASIHSGVDAIIGYLGVCCMFL